MYANWCPRGESAQLHVRTNAPGVWVRVRTKSLMLRTNTPALSDWQYAPLFNNKNEE